MKCKRPSKRESLDSNVEKAYAQLHSRLSEGDRGLVAVAVDKVLEMDGKFHRADSSHDFSSIGRSAGVLFRDLVGKHELRWLDPRIVGVMAIVRFLAQSQGSELVAYSYQLVIIKFASEHRGQNVDSLRLDRLTSSLRTEYNTAPNRPLEPPSGRGA